MNLAATLFCVLAAFQSAQAITVSVDRADVRPVTVPTDQSQSIYVNGWRPLTGVSSYDHISVDRSLAPLHPVLGKLQEHMQQAISDRLKPQRRSKPHYQALIEYSPANIPAGFTILSSKQRLEGIDPKTLSTEREYTFLVPPPREALRFEVEPLKKTPLRESEPYVRSSQFVPQAIKPDQRSPTYYIKPASFSTAVHPYSQARPFVEQYNVQQSYVSNKSPVKSYDGSKTTNDKPYYQPSNGESAGGFNKESNKIHPGQTYDRFQSQYQQAPQQVVNSNYYNQINHPSHYKQATYERDPSFLVHESHEISYVTPSYKYRPAAYQFENAQESYPSSTAPTRVESNKYTQQPGPVTRPDNYKYQTTSTSTTKDIEKQRPEAISHRNPANSFFIQDFQKTRYTPDINEVLPKVNQPVKFNQVGTTQTPYVVDHSPKVVYVRPELQQHQYQGSIIPLSINQRPAEVEYETPESISLKHFNEQQFLLQQQLIQQDRLRLREQEKRRQQELLRQQQEEVRKRQQEIKLLELKQKEKQRLEQLHTAQPDIVKELPVKPQFQPFIVDEEKKIPKEQYKYFHQQYLQQQHLQQVPRVQQHHVQLSSPPPPQPQPPQVQQLHEIPKVSSEPPFKPHEEDNVYKQVTVQKFEEVVTPTQANIQATTQEEFQPVVRPYRPQKPLNREQLRRRKPTTIVYETVPTEPPTSYVNPETPEGLTDIPIQTTALPETTTVPVTERVVIRPRRPGIPLRRRRPSSTTSTTEASASSQEYEEELSKYNTPEIQEFEKKKRVRPIANSQDGSYERRPLLRKRPGQRVKAYNKENFESLPERIRSDESLKDISPTENYPAPFLKELYSSEYFSSSEKTFTMDTPQEVSTERIPIEYYTETTVAPSSEYFEPTHNNREEQYTQKVEESASQEHVFSKTEVDQVENTAELTSPTTSTSTTTPTTTTTTTTTTEAPTSPKAILSSPKGTHRMRPVRYGNATRPRFSIKDYKSRMEYKNRLASSSSSSTEASSTVTAGPKRGYKNHQPADPSLKEAVTRYKQTSRTSYRTSSTTAAVPTSQQVDDIGTTDRPSRFTPKKRVQSTSHHYNRSRVPASSTLSTSLKQHEPESYGSHSTARPENVFSSSIRKRPTLKSKLKPLGKLNGAATGTNHQPEMQSAAETGSFATSTVTPASAVVTAVAPAASEAANELTGEPKDHFFHQLTTEESSSDKKSPEGPSSESSPVDLSDVTMDESEEVSQQQLATPADSEAPLVVDKPREEEDGHNNNNNSNNNQAMQVTSASPVSESTAPFDIRHEEELFAKASQSVADLTSSASALYDKPGMFKAVSPVTAPEKPRLTAAHLKIATDEPTLPIEAFFHEIAKKN